MGGLREMENPFIYSDGVGMRRNSYYYLADIAKL